MIVLVVADEDAIHHEARFGFPPDVTVLHARDAREAIDAMDTETPDIVVLELQAGSAGGFDLATQMRQTEGLDQVPLLFLLDREQDAWLARQAGATRWLRKPVDTTTLVDAALALSNF